METIKVAGYGCLLMKYWYYYIYDTMLYDAIFLQKRYIWRCVLWITLFVFV